MNATRVRTHEHLLALVVRARGGSPSRRDSYGMVGAGIGELLLSGHVTFELETGRVDRVASGEVGDQLLDALLRAWPPISALTGHPTDLDTWVRRATMITGHRAAELAGARLTASGVLERETDPGGIGALIRRGVRYREVDVAAVDELVATARTVAAGTRPVTGPLLLVLHGAETLQVLGPLGITRLEVQAEDLPWADVVARALRFAGVEFGFL